jgi:hypothetical protein
VFSNPDSEAGITHENYYQGKYSLEGYQKEDVSMDDYYS